ncbi:MAG: preprotein translocase subunit SecG [Verrucomicrobiales bacterium]|nr:preprotein translocase subunit SecG [Verrucomicrobiales bacterium]
MAILSILLTATIIIVSILLVLIVLVQRPKQEGLGAAFGGGTFDSALGAHTTDVLQKITTYLATIFFVTAVGLAMIKARQFSASPAGNVLEEVDKQDPAVPALPPGMSKLPGVEDATTPAPTIDDSLLDITPAPAETPAPTAPAETSAPAPDAPAETPDAPAAPKGKGDAKADEGKAAAPKGEKGDAKAEKGKADAPAAAKGDGKGKGAE